MADLSPKDVELIHALLASSKLESVECHEMSAYRNDEPPEPDAPEEGTVNIAAQYRYDDGSFGVRLIAHVTIPVGKITVSMAGEYSIADEYSPSTRTVQQFCNEVAIMSLFPYLREAVSTVSGRVFGKPLYLPMVDRGEITLDVQDVPA
ncbi:hypothetical protein ITJ44_15570 [Clavibacter sp. VKM Ac-2873]|uniref:Uncharacterized protein n=1 Tax=Clavibacter capsici TaxID=1874630 RepID=A0A0M3RRY5_9MICO|nr:MULTISPECIES: hypothetical protein [Clavibacter]ALD14429.1 hypothetical protein AES38_15265 [Clavibacter capsici]MBF4619494.1 hypothetical protein [Clavibacter sp. VKM Ac-2873]QIS40570.1 hypothetical protein GW572_15475 [Clavibacter capsici]QIS43498.1 hypothetical protein GW571_14745 [Clavibacter capsici]QIS46455.1 hypothetical protein GW570_14805 [Clavibacter capsici]